MFVCRRVDPFLLSGPAGKVELMARILDLKS